MLSAPSSNTESSSAVFPQINQKDAAQPQDTDARPSNTPDPGQDPPGSLWAQLEALRQCVCTCDLPQRVGRLFMSNLGPNRGVVHRPPPEAQFFTYAPSVLQETYPPLKSDDQPIPDTRHLVFYLQQPDGQQKRLQALAFGVVKAFSERIDTPTPDFEPLVQEVVILAKLPDPALFQALLRGFINAIGKEMLLIPELLTGLAQTIRFAAPGQLSADDGVRILRVLADKLGSAHEQDPKKLLPLTDAITALLDALADTHVSHIPAELLSALNQCLKGLQSHEDPAFHYQAAYAYQALLNLPDHQKPMVWQEALLQSGVKTATGVLNVISAAKNIDVHQLTASFDQFAAAWENVQTLVNAAKEAYEQFQSLSQNVQEGVASLQQGKRHHQHSWYHALRSTEILIQGQQFGSFERLVRVTLASYDRSEMFLWGLCDQLKQLAETHSDISIRQNALKFLGELYQNDPLADQHVSVRQKIEQVLQDFARNPNAQVRRTAQAVLTQLNRTFNVPQSIPAPELTAFPTELLTAAQQKPLEEQVSDTNQMVRLVLDLLLSKDKQGLLLQENIWTPVFQELKTAETSAERLKTQQLQGLVDERDVERYIEPLGKHRPEAQETFGLKEKVQRFLDDPKKKVLLLMGDAGAGKSTFTRRLAYELWNQYEAGGRIPLFIHLPSLENPTQNLLEGAQGYLTKKGFSERQIQLLKDNGRFLFILDGFDELGQRDKNLYQENQLNEWQAQVIISCRTEYCEPGYENYFQPFGTNDRPIRGAFEQLVVAPFSEEKIDNYIDKYVAVEKPEHWNAERYQEAIKAVPSDLLSNPFILKMTLDVLPDWESQQEGVQKRLTRLNLYGAFMDDWFGKAQTRLERLESQKQLQDDEQSVWPSLRKDFQAVALERIQALALKLQHTQQVVVTYPQKEDPTWDPFFGEAPKVRLLRSGYPLTRTEHRIGQRQKESHYRFIHKSLQEYFVARAIYEACIQPSATPADTVQKTLLGQHNLVGDPNILRFLVEFAQQGEQAPVFKAHLHDLIEYSKTDEAGGIAAANAMTILVKAGVQFNGADLKGIRIPGADLSYGVFDQAQFDGADLRDVNFSTAWLREAYFNNAKMDKVRFGEWPFIELKTPAYACAYSPDGKEAAIATGQEIKIYDAQTLKEKRTLSGHTDTVWSVVYSPNGEQIASGSDDKTVRLWDAKTGKALAVIQGFHGGVYSVASDTAPDGGWRLLTGGSDKAVRLWQVKEPVRPGEPCLVALCWTSTQAVLTALKMNLQGVQGLSEMNASLLAQRGAVGKPSSQTQTAQSSQPQSSNLISRLFLRPLESFTASVRGSSASSATPSGSSLFSSQTTSTPLGPGQLA